MSTSIKEALAISIFFAISGISTMHAQSTIDKLQPLVEASARRLAIAEQVALAKWDSQTPVEDAAREAQVITSAVKDGESRGLDRTYVSKFFMAQIEANKVVQYSLLANWHRVGHAPDHTPINLATTIRPELDQLQRKLIEGLAETEAIRASKTCGADTAKAVGIYFAAHRRGSASLQAIALDRAMAAACTDK